ncbi:MAG: PHP domain-containing protein [Candidatus Pacebacteria bacterium]|nr:PHP domain-containing protein [Candidatus Paceibacterota bacterium]
MKIDLHCHTKHSYDASSDLKDIIKEARKKGLDGIAVADHDNTRAWEEAKKADFPVILGEEIKTSKGDVLGLFLKEEIKGRKKDPRWVMEEIKKQGGVVVVPHPFHDVERFRDDLENYLDLIDGLEVFNGRRPFSFPDKKAYEFALKHNLAMTGGTDAHYFRPIGDVYTECEAKTLEEFKQALLNRKTRAKGKKSNLIYFFCPMIEKTKRFLFKKTNHVL